MASRTGFFLVLSLLLTVGRAQATAQQAGAGEGAWLSTRLAAGALVDTNPLFLPAGDPPVGLGPWLAAELNLRSPWLAGRHQLWGALRGSRVFFSEIAGAAEVEVNEVNTTALRALAFYTYRPSSAGGGPRASVGYDGGLVLLDGFAPLADDNHIFVEIHSAWLRLGWLSEWGETAVSYRVARQSFADAVRSNWSNRLAIEHRTPTWQRWWGWSGRLSLRHERAALPDYDRLAPGADLILWGQGPWGLRLNLAMGFEHRNHFRSAHGQWDEQRMDNALELGATLERALIWGLGLQLSFWRQQHLSSVPTFAGERSVLLLALCWGYPTEVTGPESEYSAPNGLEVPVLEWRRSSLQVDIEGGPRP